MSTYNFKDFHILSDEKKNIFISELNILLQDYSAEKRISWALNNLPNRHVMSSSFGIQSSVLLHLMIQQKPDIPVILIDTGYLFAETYRFIDILTNKFKINLKIFRSDLSPAWQEARYGKLWKNGIKGIESYNNINKVKPMNTAFKQLLVKTWFSGLRREQSNSRSLLQYLSVQNNIFKVLPILDWSKNMVFQYLNTHNLLYHPLWKEGYVSVGDTHTTRKYTKGMKEEETRFFGLKRECGLHKF